MKIVFSGGYTMGPVVPLLAIHDQLKRQEQIYQPLWIGTRKGPEKKAVFEKGISYRGIFAGKWRRYFSLKNFFDIFATWAGIFQSFVILYQFRPDIIVAASGFVSFPVVFAGWLLKVPCLIHQQDVYPSLTNKLLIPFAKKITLTHKSSLQHFPAQKAVWTGQPLRAELFTATKNEAYKMFNLQPGLPVLFITGGGSGALAINKFISQGINELLQVCQIIHLTGKGREDMGVYIKDELAERYHKYEFFTKEMPYALAVADVVVSRGGASTTAEIAALGKPSILIPMPNTHQEYNTEIFKEADAAYVLNQKKLDSQSLVAAIIELLQDKNLQETFRLNLLKLYKPDGVYNVVREIKEIIYL